MKEIDQLEIERELISLDLEIREIQWELNVLTDSLSAPKSRTPEGNIFEKKRASVQDAVSALMKDLTTKENRVSELRPRSQPGNEGKNRML